MGKEIRVDEGCRVGFWNSKGTWREKNAFRPMGYYIGPSLGDVIPGQKFDQELMEGTLKFRVGVLFRPDLGKRDRLETIIILETYFPEMWDYETWESEEDAASALSG